MSLMNNINWKQAIEQTWTVRLPKQKLSTFGLTNVEYFVVSEPIYHEFDTTRQEGVIRTGRVVAEKPKIVTPTYALNLEGFSNDAYEYFQHMSNQEGPNSTGILYQYQNHASKVEIVGGSVSDIANRISKDLEAKNEDMSVVLVGVDALWDVALMKFIYEFTSASYASNLNDFKNKGLLEPQQQYGGVPRMATEQIERLFEEVHKGADVEILKRELDRWGLFSHYENQFLDLFE